MTKIYFDTEFTGLHSTAALISIGLVNSDGSRTFYAELSDTYTADDCSPFCKAEVLPLLEHGDCVLNLADLRVQLTNWLALESNPVLVCDCARDVVQLTQLFPDGLPPSCSYKVISFWENLKRRIFNMKRRLHRKHGLRVHHALDDALVNRMILSKER